MSPLFRLTPLEDVKFFSDEERARYYRVQLRDLVEKDKKITPASIIENHLSWADIVEHDEFMEVVYNSLR